MDEIVLFLKQYDIDACVHVVYENERMETPPSIFNRKPKFGVLLTSNDPPHWMTKEAETVSSLEEFPVSDHHSIVYPFTFTINEAGQDPTNLTDSRGWQYANSFHANTWSHVPYRGCGVRRRKWERLSVKENQYQQCESVLPQYYNRLTEFRSLHPTIIKYTHDLADIPYKIQYIVENQRKHRGEYSMAHLNPVTDPPGWSVGPCPHLLDDPTQCSFVNLREYDPQSAVIDRTNLMGPLHEFFYTVYPNQDTFGWEYNYNFSDEWHKTSFADDLKSHTKENDFFVRRRVWFRTLVSYSDLNSSKASLTGHLSRYPSGVPDEGDILLLNSMGNKWISVAVSLLGHHLMVRDNSKRKKIVKKFDIRDLVLRRLGATDCPGKSTGFGLRLKRYDNINSFEAIFSAETRERSEFWSRKVEFQMCQVDLTRRLNLGPPIFEEILLVNDMWLLEKSMLSNKWNLYTFELLNSGFVRLFNGADLKMQFDIVKCKYAIKSDIKPTLRTPSKMEFCGDGSLFEFCLFLRDYNELYIRAMSIDVLDKWIRGLVSFHAERKVDMTTEDADGCTNQMLPAFIVDADLKKSLLDLS